MTEALSRTQRTKLDEQARKPHLQANDASEEVTGQTSLQARRRAAMTLACAIEEYLQDHEGGNSSRKTLEWHYTALGLLQALPAEERWVAFCRCWTRKEAYIKAVGRGLSIPLNQFDVSPAPEIPAAFLASREDPQAVNSWSLQELTLRGDYVGAMP